MWDVEFEDAFEAEFLTFSRTVQNKVLAAGRVLSDEGPQLGRPYADTLKGSKHANMKELRFAADGGEWRIAFAFDPRRRAILLVAGDKTGISETRFYKWLIATADQRFSAHLAAVKPTTKKGG
jgi:hypothetical protein